MYFAVGKKVRNKKWQILYPATSNLATLTFAKKKQEKKYDDR